MRAKQVSDRKRAIGWVSAIVLLIALIALLVLSWNAGGPQVVREISKPVAVPGLPR
jgi:hypothetical protein